MKKLLPYLLFLVVFSPLNLIGQESFEYKEQVFIQTDQESYVTGEYVWFSAYVLDDASREFSDLSKILYVEILDRNNEVKLQTKISLEYGKGNGSLFLPASLISDVYQVRAYTRWMQNSPPSNYFHKQLRIFNPFIPVATQEKSNKTEIRALFYPEGGKLVSGLESRVVFHVSDESWKGIPFRGMVISDRQDTVLRFTPVRNGMGSFTFTPSDSLIYRAEIRNVYDSLISTVSLPEIHPNGMVVKVTPGPTRITASVVCSGCRDGETFNYRIIQKGNVPYDGQDTIKSGSASITVDKQLLPAGISQLIIEDISGSYDLIRSLFRMPETGEIKISLSERETGTRQKVDFSLENDSLAHVSVRVVHEDALFSPGKNPVVRLYFNSVMAMQFDDPDYYLSGEPEATELLDNAMVMYGWVPVIKYRSELHLPEYRGQVIEARVTDPETSEGVNNISVYASLAGQPFVFRVGLSDSTGMVRFQARDLPGERTLVIRPANLQDTTLNITVFPSYSSEKAKTFLPELNANRSLKAALESRSLGMQMDNIYHGSAKSRLEMQKSDSLPFFGEADHTYYLDDYTRFPSLVDVMKEYVYSVAARKRNDRYIFRVFNDDENAHFNEQPLILLDGVAVMDSDKMIKYDALLIEKIEVISGRYVYGPMSFPGVVSFSTYKGTMEGFGLPESVLIENYDGVQYKRRFFSPDYNNPDEGISRKPDMRNLLYWNPDLTLENNASGSFYTSDVSGTFVLIVEGLSADGTPVKGMARFEVKPELFSEK